MPEAAGTLKESAPGPATADGAQLGDEARLTLVELSVTPDGNEFIVGDRWRGEFVSLPAIALVIIDAIRAGKTLGEAGAIAHDHNGEDVDVLDFASTLIALGFVTEIDGIPVANGEGPRLHDGGRLGERLASLARPLFSRPAWVTYGTLFMACLLVLILLPGYRPRAKQLFFLHNPLVSFAILTIVDSIIVGSHELAHWLAARVQGLPARITISRRLYILVYQTDLTAVWSLPRRKRFGPLLAGMAFHTVLLTGLLAARMTAHAGLWHPPAMIARLLAALVLLVSTGLAFQFFIFIRTDIYAVLAIGFGCLNLTRINHLLLKRALRPLSASEARELEEAHPQDVRIASWYRWLYLAGLAFASWYLIEFFVPWGVTIIVWIAAALTHTSPDQPQFWETVIIGAIAISPFLLPFLMLARDRYQRLRQHLSAARDPSSL